MRVVGVTLLLAAGLFAGCVEDAGNSFGIGSTSPPLSPSASVNQEKGGIEGIVVDDVFYPVSGALVNLAGTDLKTVTNATGAYAFSLLEPGPYEVVAGKVNYSVGKRLTTVEAGKIVKGFTVQIIPVPPEDLVYRKFFDYRGHFDCSHLVAVIVLYWRGDCGYTPNTGPSPVPWPNQDNIFEFEVAKNWSTIVSEAKWNPGSVATGTKMALMISYKERPTNGTHWFSEVEAPPPLQARCNFDKLGTNLCNGTKSTPPTTLASIPQNGATLVTALNVGAMKIESYNNQLMGFAWDQTFDVWVSIQYYERFPPGWSVFQEPGGQTTTPEATGVEPGIVTPLLV